MSAATSRSTARAFIALGANLDDPQAQILRACERIAGLPHTALLRRSSLYRTPPWGVAEQPEFVNAVAQIDTALAPRQLLCTLLDVEAAAGRQRTLPNGPRTLDLDLLLYAGLRCHEPGLTIPHPRMQQRAFVLVPLLEIAPDCEIPGLGHAADWLARCDVRGIIRIP